MVSLPLFGGNVGTDERWAGTPFTNLRVCIHRAVSTPLQSVLSWGIGETVRDTGDGGEEAV